MRALRAMLGVLLPFLLLTACGPKKPTGFALWATEPTPATWDLNRPWVFTLLDEQGGIRRSMTIQFTDQKAKTCIGGDWRKVVVVSESPLMEPAKYKEAIPQSEPSYLLKGRALMVVLTADSCDNYYTFRGELTVQGFEGTYGWEGLGIAEKASRFYAVPLFK